MIIGNLTETETHLSGFAVNKVEILPFLFHSTKVKKEPLKFVKY